MSKILVVEDDPELRELIQLYLQRDQFQVLLAEDGVEAFHSYSLHQPDLIILDIMLPKSNGLEVCKKIRQSSHVPILFLSSRGESEDIVNALSVGGDTYITKPFDPNVLVAKVKATLRRETYAKEHSQILRYGHLEIDLQSYEVRSHGKPIVLSSKEMQLLLFLAQNPNKVFSVEQIYAEVWGPHEYGDMRTVMVHMSHLRKKVEQDPSNPRHIITVRGFGYKFQAD